MHGGRPPLLRVAGRPRIAAGSPRRACPGAARAARGETADAPDRPTDPALSADVPRSAVVFRVSPPSSAGSLPPGAVGSHPGPARSGPVPPRFLPVRSHPGSAPVPPAAVRPAPDGGPASGRRQTRLAGKGRPADGRRHARCAGFRSSADVRPATRRPRGSPQGPDGGARTAVPAPAVPRRPRPSARPPGRASPGPRTRPVSGHGRRAPG